MNELHESWKKTLYDEQYEGAEIFQEKAIEGIDKLINLSRRMKGNEITGLLAAKELITNLKT